jgi:acyl carrier protein
MTREDVATTVRRILSEDFRIATDRITDQATLRGTLGLDSMDAVDFLLLLHKDFGFEARIENYRQIESVGDLIDFVHRRVNDDRS